MTQTSGHCFHPSVGQSLSSGAEMCMNFANITIALEGEQNNSIKADWKKCSRAFTKSVTALTP